jgi:hypothetical protein
VSYRKIFSDLQARFAESMRQDPPAEARGDISPSDRALVRNLLAGVVATVAHEREMEDARGKEPVSVRLVPQVPVKDRDAAVAWIGGGARLPSGMAWPSIDGSALQLLAQFDCARLPKGLWDGLGPRSGWLAIFVDPNTVQAKVMHFDSVGDFRQSPPVLEGCNIVGYGGSQRAAAAGYSWVFPAWPVDVVAVVDGRNDPRGDGVRRRRDDRYNRRHDFVDDRRGPFDWATVRMMLDMALAAYQDAMPKGMPAHLSPEALAKLEQAIADAERAGATEDDVCEKRIALDEHRAIVATRSFASKNHADVMARLAALKVQVEDMAGRQPFSMEAIAPVLQGMKAMTWMHKSMPPLYRDGKKLSGTQRFKEGVHLYTLPLTTHDPAAHPTWVHQFERRLLEAAQPIYLRDPAKLPAALVADCEKVWRDMVTGEIAGVGHVPWGYVHEYDEDEDVTLLELPSSDLIGWMFGDVYALVITMKIADLKKGDFSRPLVQITN